MQQYRKRDRLKAIFRRRRLRVPAKAVMLATVPAIALSGFAPISPATGQIETGDMVIREAPPVDLSNPVDLSILAAPPEAASQPVADAEIDTDRTLLGTFPASYYGPGFAGRPTASGETFNPAQMTAAHRTLPFGTMVEVTNTANGKTVVVRINDRGPFHGNRAIDLSEGAAAKIGMKSSGTAKVTLHTLS